VCVDGVQSRSYRAVGEAIDSESVVHRLARKVRLSVVADAERSTLQNGVGARVKRKRKYTKEDLLCSSRELNTNSSVQRLCDCAKTS
jgi:hypothetical protein